MYVHFTNTQVIIGSFALFLIFSFALAAFLDKRWRTAFSLHNFGSDQKPNALRQSSRRDNKDGSSNLYTRYADLSVSGLGTAEQRITLRGEPPPNTPQSPSSLRITDYALSKRELPDEFPLAKTKSSREPRNGSRTGHGVWAPLSSGVNLRNGQV